jgi:hypothetical protein
MLRSSRFLERPSLASGPRPHKAGLEGALDDYERTEYQRILDNAKDRTKESQELIRSARALIEGAKASIKRQRDWLRDRFTSRMITHG